MSILKTTLRPYKIDGELIRLSSRHDCGYIINKEVIKNINRCYTYGIGSDISFENEMLDINPYIKTYLYDHAVSQPTLKPNMTFFKNGLSGHKEGELNSFFNHVIENKDSLNEKILLKIDAEGAEYPLFNENSIELFQNLEAMIIEFHYIENQLDNFLKILNDINKYFFIVHIHGNNCAGQFNHEGFICPSVPEITFLNRKRYEPLGFLSVKYPIAGLDYPNNPNKGDLEIDFL